MAVVDPADDAATTAWAEADARGFHDAGAVRRVLRRAVRGDFAAAADRRRLRRRRRGAAPSRSRPSTSWPAALTVPGGEVTGWAISAVTVAPTHRRRGIARAMLESELRVAVAAGAAARDAHRLGGDDLPPLRLRPRDVVDGLRDRRAPRRLARRARAAGRAPAGRPGRRDGDAARPLLEEARRATVGDVADRRPPVRPAVRRPLRRRRPAEAPLRPVRRRGRHAARSRGLPARGGPARLRRLHRRGAAAASPPPTTRTAALWRSSCSSSTSSHTVQAPLRAVDEPLRWLVRDPRMIRTTELREHLWIRVLDPIVALAARTYARTRAARAPRRGPARARGRARSPSRRTPTAARSSPPTRAGGGPAARAARRRARLAVPRRRLRGHARARPGGSGSARPATRRSPTASCAPRPRRPLTTWF